MYAFKGFVMALLVMMLCIAASFGFAYFLKLVCGL